MALINGCNSAILCPKIFESTRVGFSLRLPFLVRAVSPLDRFRTVFFGPPFFPLVRGFPGISLGSVFFLFRHLKPAPHSHGLRFLELHAFPSKLQISFFCYGPARNRYHHFTLSARVFHTQICCSPNPFVKAYWLEKFITPLPPLDQSVLVKPL